MLGVGYIKPRDGAKIFTLKCKRAWNKIQTDHASLRWKQIFCYRSFDGSSQTPEDSPFLSACGKGCTGNPSVGLFSVIGQRQRRQALGRPSEWAWHKSTWLSHSTWARSRACMLQSVFTEQSDPTQVWGFSLTSLQAVLASGCHLPRKLELGRIFHCVRAFSGGGASPLGLGLGCYWGSE